MSDHPKTYCIRGREVSEWEYQNLQRQVLERFDHANFPERQAKWAKAERAGKQQPENTEWRKHWQRVKAGLCGDGVILAFIGGRGTGKTQLAACAGLHVCERWHAQYWRAASMFARIKSSYQPSAKESERDVLNDLTKPRLLVVDEIGECNATEWEGRALANIVCQRHDECLDTILVSNHQSAEDFARAVGDSITDRIAQGGGVFAFTWPSFRRLAAKSSHP